MYIVNAYLYKCANNIQKINSLQQPQRGMMKLG